MANSLMIRSQDEDRLFSRNVTARLARVPLDFLERCEQEALVRPGRMPGGGIGYTLHDIHELIRIRRLQQDLGLDLDAIAVVLHMRRRMVEMLREMNALEARMWEREQRLRSELHRLRRQLSAEARFR